MSEEERRLVASLGGHTSWSNTRDRTERTEAPRAAFDQRFYDAVDPDRLLSEEEREQRAASARKAYFARLSLKAAKARRLAAERRKAEQ